MTNDMMVLVLVGTFLCTTGLVLFGLYFRTKPTTLADRLQPNEIIMDKDGHQVEAVLLSPNDERRKLQKWLRPLDRIGQELAGTESDKFATRKLLLMAGFRRQNALGVFTSCKFLFGIVCILLFLFGVLESGNRLSLNGLAGSLVLLFFSSFAAEVWLKMRAASRGGRLSSSLPDALDLMVICAEAGLPLGRIFKTVSKELAFSAPEIAEELGYTYAELQILSDRTKALLNLSERCGVENVEAMVSTLIQAERYGTPLSQALRTISEESRKRLVLDLEEKAGKLPAQLSVPLMVFILPPVIAMMGAPAMIRIIRMLGS